MKLARRITALIVLPAAFAGAALVASATPSSAAVSTTTMASQVISLTNAQRAKHGCRPLATNRALNASALAHSRDMVSRNYFSHVSPRGSTFVTRARAAGYQHAMAENIAWGYRTPAQVVAAWMKSPGHRKNILNCGARSVGVGVWIKSNGAPYWTQVFGRA